MSGNNRSTAKERARELLEDTLDRKGPEWMKKNKELLKAQTRMMIKVEPEEVEELIVEMIEASEGQSDDGEDDSNDRITITLDEDYPPDEEDEDDGKPSEWEKFQALNEFREAHGLDPLDPSDYGISK